MRLQKQRERQTNKTSTFVFAAAWWHRPQTRDNSTGVAETNDLESEACLVYIV